MSIGIVFLCWSRIVAKAMVTITAYNADGYSKRICTMSDVQVQTNESRVRGLDITEADSFGPVGVVIDPKLFSEMDRFVVSVELLTGR